MPKEKHIARRAVVFCYNLFIPLFPKRPQNVVYNVNSFLLHCVISKITFTIHIAKYILRWQITKRLIFRHLPLENQKVDVEMKFRQVICFGF